MVTAQDRKSRKSRGIHYTPSKLAMFLARRLWLNAGPEVSDQEPVKILDPACGDGMLLNSLVAQFAARPTRIAGFETNPFAVEQARSNLACHSHCDVEIIQQDFLDFVLQQPTERFDIVIVNPPYVRTQVLGQQKSQELAQAFGLKGRVDLYHAFLIAISRILKSGGWLGALTPNRFLYTQAGRSSRQLLREHYQVAELYDLGDTKLFEAAVLPAVFIASKGKGNLTRTQERCHRPFFLRVEKADQGSRPIAEADDLFAAIENTCRGSRNVFSVDRVCYRAESGQLQMESDGGEWRLQNEENQAWLSRIAESQHLTIGDVADVKVGIKSTADSVFIRNDWRELPIELQPESSLLRPLITHKTAGRWHGLPSETKVLYPYEDHPNRTAVDLANYPRGCAYLNEHKERLSRRKYLADAGRSWFEIWVPHRPNDWQAPKVVWPDISEQPRFFLDTTGSVVNGDCYWIKLRPGQPVDLLYLILAVANSDVAVKFYDYLFHNKLYGKRRRFMSQYVKRFPLPDPETKISQQIVEVVKQMVSSNALIHKRGLESEVNALVHQVFGLEEDSIESSS